MLPKGAVHIPCEFFYPCSMAAELDFVSHVTVKGVAKIARKLRFDHAEAVVRAFFHLMVQLDVTADLKSLFPNSLVLYCLHRPGLSSRNAEHFP